MPIFAKSGVGAFQSREKANLDFISRIGRATETDGPIPLASAILKLRMLYPPFRFFVARSFAGISRSRTARVTAQSLLRQVTLIRLDDHLDSHWMAGVVRGSDLLSDQMASQVRRPSVRLEYCAAGSSYGSFSADLAGGQAALWICPVSI